MRSDEQQPREVGKQAEITCRLATRSVGSLQPHPSYTRHKLTVSVSQLSALIELGEIAFQQPIIVTANGTIVDGYARWQLAKRQGRETILCLEYEMTDEEALRWLVKTHRPLRGINSYCRTLLALDLAPFLHEAARDNQRLGGQQKGLSDLTEAQKLDVRAETASTAGVSSGNITKVEQVARSAPPEIHDSLRSGEITIHKAWQWRRLSPQQQAAKLEEYRSQKGTTLTSRRLIQKHVAKLVPTRLIPSSLGELLKDVCPARPAALDSITVSEIEGAGNVAYLTKGAMAALKDAEEST